AIAVFQGMKAFLLVENTIYKNFIEIVKCFSNKGLLYRNALTLFHIKVINFTVFYTKMTYL
ncbi:hypothetical protein BUY12_04695, partial [Staphylococcus chromogenes]|uniref:hypothetical protein n=1 Tax=Staphylococcus chromogenes TaxID=46126 RepID=UPI000D494C87